MSIVEKFEEVRGFCSGETGGGGVIFAGVVLADKLSVVDFDAKLGSHGRNDIAKVMAITNWNGMGDRSIPLRGIGYLDTCKYPAG